MPQPRRRSKLFYKYLLSYTVILLLPLTIMGLFTYNYFINLLKREVLTNNLNVLSRAKNVIETQLITLNGISDQIYMNKNLKYFYLANNVDAASITINELRNYIVMNPFIENIVYYNRGDNFLYTSTSSCSLSLFKESIYHYENWSIDKFIEDINTIEVPTYRPMENVTLQQYSKKRMLTYIYPVSSKGFTANRTIMFIIPEESFSVLLENELKGYEGASVIIDENSQIITSYDPDSRFTSEMLKELPIFDGNSINKTVIMEQQKYLISCIKSKETNWKYITMVPVKTVMKKINTVQLAFAFGLILILLAVSGTIYFMTCLNFKPIEKLRLYAQGIMKDGKEELNELDAVKNTITFLNDQNCKLNTELENHVFATKEYLLTRLLTGQITDMEEFHFKCKKIGLFFDKPVYRVVLFYVRDLKGTEQLISCIEKSLTGDITGFAKSAPDRNIILILCYDAGHDDSVNNTLISLQKSLHEKTGLIITLGAGNSRIGVADVPKSYIEAMTAIDYRLVKGVNRVIFFKEITVNQWMANYYMDFSPDKLKSSIMQGDMLQVGCIVNKAIDFIKQNNTPITIARLLCFDIINTVVKAMNEINRLYPLPKEVYPDVFILSKFETVDELSEIVQKISIDIDQYINNMERTPGTLDLILNYIKSNYRSCDFTIQQVADYFHMSLPNISIYFKGQTGTNIIDYCTNLKIEKAKHLLSSTESPLKDISVEVGYYNVTSFIRRFKQVVGVTPGEYRKNNTEFTGG